jgi:uncharacterized SAM-binding protein YcdF (DUF218 family)
MLTTFFQTLNALVEPIGFLWFLQMAAAAAMLYRRRRRPALAFAALALFVWLIGGSGLPDRLLGGLERPHVRDGLTGIPVCDAVVMLGGGHRHSEHDTFEMDLTAAADRAITAMELIRQRKAPVLVLGGNAYKLNGQRIVEAELLQRWFAAWQLTNAPVLNLGINANTHDEAVHTKALCSERGWQRVILVTSAFHMKRAEAVFRTAGVNVVTVACDFQTSCGEKTAEVNVIPRAEGFQQLGLYLHEVYGWLYYRLRGWIQVDASPGTTGK